MDVDESLREMAAKRSFQRTYLDRQPQSKSMHLLTLVHQRMGISRRHKAAAPSEIHGSIPLDETGLSSPPRSPINFKEETMRFHKGLVGKRSTSRSSANIPLQRGSWTPNQPFIRFLSDHKHSSKRAKNDPATSEKKESLSLVVKTAPVTPLPRLKLTNKTISSQLCNNSFEA